MKMRTLRRKDNKEFASFMEGEMFTQEHPFPLGDGATIEGLKQYCDEDDIDWDEYEIVEIGYFVSISHGTLRCSLQTGKSREFGCYQFFVDFYERFGIFLWSHIREHKKEQLPENFSIKKIP